jgi:hypothetical protein
LPPLFVLYRQTIYVKRHINAGFLIQIKTS